MLEKEVQWKKTCMRKTKGMICIGTSGLSDAHWRGAFYPPAVRDDEMLGIYSRTFQSVEINNSFYHLPSQAALESWLDATPEDFVFSVKSSRYITHMKKLKDSGQSLQALLERITLLGDKLGPLLFQLPPKWRYNHERLAQFLDSLGRDFRCAFEFRDPSWLNPRCYELLRRHGAALCLYELDGFASPWELTADFVYVRLHGPGGPYQGSYDARSLSVWADALTGWAQEGRDIYCYFDNDEAGFAAQNAEALQAMLRKK